MKIAINNLTKCYKTKKKKTLALNHVTLEFQDGEIACILGHNGAGKTTLVKSICGLLKPDEGEIYLNDKPISKNLDYAHKNCGTVLEGSRNIYYYLTAYENLQYFGMLNGLEKAMILELTDMYLELFDLKEFRNVTVNSFSRGMQQKLAIVIALMKKPDILLLDEPTLGLDIVSADSVIKILKQLADSRNISIIVTTHDINLIEQLNCRLVFMNKGTVIQDMKLIDFKKQKDKPKYKITFLKESEIPLPSEYKVINQAGEIVIFETMDYGWMRNFIQSPNLIQIEKCNQSVIDIYKGVMNSNG